MLPLTRECGTHKFISAELSVFTLMRLFINCRYRTNSVTNALFGGSTDACLHCSFDKLSMSRRQPHNNKQHRHSPHAAVNQCIVELRNLFTPSPTNMLPVAPHKTEKLKFRGKLRYSQCTIVFDVL